MDEGPDLLAARVIGARYRLIERLGGGSTAVVYRTHDTRTGATVATRLLARELADDPYYRRRFLDHVEAYRRAAPHESLVELLDVVEAGPRLFTVSEFVEITALPNVLSSGPVAVMTAVGATAKLAQLLDHLHARSVLARDLRPGAVFVGVNGNGAPPSLKLSIDALATGPVCAPDPASPLHVQLPAVAAVYTPPERVRGEPGTASGDIYALGALCFEMVTGQPLFRGSVSGILSQHLHDPPPVLRRIDPTLPGALEELLARMLAKVPRFRPSAAAVMYELDAIAASLPVSLG